MYKLYVDKNENFECEVAVKNASLKGSKARLIVESTDGTSLIFNGKIEGGKCVIPVRRLKGLLEDADHGEMSLEVIVEDTYFQPWKSDFVVEKHTDVKVKINEQKQPTKPTVQVKVSPQKKDGSMLPIYELMKLCEQFGIKRANVAKRARDFRQLVTEYFRSNPEFQKEKPTVLRNLKHFLK